MSAAIAVSVALVCVSALVAWRWWLVERRLAREQKDRQRDEVLATFEPRLRELEDVIKNQRLAKMVR